MFIAIGSTNPAKIHAVEEVIKDYAHLSSAKVLVYNVPSGVSEQPFSMQEIVRGAKNRAKNAFKACGKSTYSFGIESGLFKAKGTNTGYLEACICCIYDGKKIHTGLSCGFEIPPKILEFVINKKMDLSQACAHSGITTNTKLGSAEGLIGLLTKGRVPRKEYTKQCIVTALIQLENAEWYA